MGEILKIDEKKEKIRERYKGIDPDRLEIIPAVPQEDFYDENKIKRVAVYARVSTGDPRQTSSYELQKNHYVDMVTHRPDWKLQEIYADEGISGTSLKHRDAFLKMITDCQQGKIDLIVTKSVSRFARNVVDCIGYVRALAALDPPVGVYFETENIYTLNPNAEMSLSFVSTIAQEESHTKSEIMNTSIEMRFRRGIFLTPVLLGFDHDSEGNLIVNEKEARIAKLCFYLYYLGYSSQYIANLLTSLKCETKKGNITWSPNTILSILQNERYCGDILARKTWTPNYLNHKSKKNRQDRNQYRQKDHHQAIIPRDLFIAVQHLISNRKYGTQSHLPHLEIIRDGPFKGFVSINPRWASFKSKDYQDASISVYDDLAKIESRPLEFESNPDTSLYNYEITHAEYFNIVKRPYLVFSKDDLRFSLSCIHELQNQPYIEIFIHPGKYQLVIRTINEFDRNYIRWRTNNKEKIMSRNISGKAFIPTIYDLCGWEDSFKYSVLGFSYEAYGSTYLLFDLKDTEILIPKKNESGNESYFAKRDFLKTYPEQWDQGFGLSFKEQLKQYNIDSLQGNLEFSPYFSDSYHIQSFTTEQLQLETDQLIDEIKQENLYV